jgi:hypothetical protein
LPKLKVKHFVPREKLLTLSTGQKIISALAKMAKSLIWRELRDYSPKGLLCKAFSGFVLYLASDLLHN